MVCSVTFSNWTFPEAEVRLGEHRELRQDAGAVRDDQAIDRAGRRRGAPVEPRQFHLNPTEDSLLI